MKHIILSENIDILLLQETEIEPTCDSNLLTFPGYNLEVEKNSTKARVGMFVKNEIKYKKIQNMEGVDSHLLVIGLFGVPYR